MAKKKFERASRTLKRYTDNVGTVRIRVTLADPDRPNSYKKGNLSKQISVKNSRVSEIVKAVEKHGPLGSRDSVVGAAGIKLKPGRAALDVALSRELVVRWGTQREPQHGTPAQYEEHRAKLAQETGTAKPSAAVPGGAECV